MKLSHLSDDELREVAKKKLKNGRYTSEAKRAQRMLWIRKGCPFRGYKGGPNVNLDWYDRH